MEPEAQGTQSPAPSEASQEWERPKAMRGVLPTPPLPSALRNPVVLMTAVGVALIAVFFWRYWGGISITSSPFINATFIGIAVGALYAM